MVLTRSVLARKDRVAEETRRLMGGHWPGPTEEYDVPENVNVRCRAVRPAGEHNGFVWLEAIYEG